MPPQERRAAILDAVIPLVMEHGDRVTTKQIAEAAGIAEGTIFRVFADKTELFRAIGERMHDQAPRERAIAEIDRGRPLEEQLVEAVAITQRRMVEIFTVLSRLGPAAHPREPRPLMDSPELARIFEEIRKNTEQQEARGATPFAEITDDDIDNLFSL